MYPAIFLDRDGVLIENRADYVRSWSDVTLIPEAMQALALLAKRNYKTIVVTNQSAVGRGLISLESAKEINSRLVNLIHQYGGKVDAVYMCPHNPDEGCSCRKPKPGLLLQAAEELSLDVSHSWMIGDAWSDVQAGQTAGVKQAVLLRTGRGKDQLLQPHPENGRSPLVFDNLALALDAIFTIDEEQVRSDQR